MEENKIKELKKTNRVIYELLELAETDYFPVEKLADLFYSKQLKEAMEYTNEEDVKDRLKEAIKSKEVKEK